MKDISAAAKPRLEPLEPECWPPVVAGMRDQLPSHLNVYRTMAHNGHLLAAWVPLRKCIVADAMLTPRQLELVTLRVARNTGTRYEWQHHVRRGMAAGLTYEDIERVRIGGPGDFEEGEQALISAVDDLHRRHAISDATWHVLARSCEPAQMLAIIATVGFYVSLAYVINSCNVQMESSDSA